MGKIFDHKGGVAFLIMPAHPSEPVPMGWLARELFNHGAERLLDAIKEHQIGDAIAAIALICRSLRWKILGIRSK